MEIIDGNAIAGTIYEELREEVARVSGRPPAAAFIRVGDDPASVAYVGKKQAVAKRIGIESHLRVLPFDVTREDLFACIDALNRNSRIDGFIVQAPLPPHLNEAEAFDRVVPEKDIDGFSSVNLGRLLQEDSAGFVACTPAGVVELLHRSGVRTEGRHVVILGRSIIVGKTLSMLLLRKHAAGNATVTVCHSRTPDLGHHTRQADILISAVGKPAFITADWVKPGAVVIDVGVNRVQDTARKSGYRLVGDIDFEAVSPLASKITPVPGGVGPMTVAFLMRNTFKAYRQQREQNAR